MRQAIAQDAIPELEIRLLGKARVIVAGVPVKFARSATTLSLLGLIVLRRGHAVSRRALAFALFPDLGERLARKELRRYLSLAMQALPARTGEPWLIVDAQTVRWNAASGAFVDIIEFERLAGDASAHASAVDLYSGDLLEEVYDDWVVAERERLRGLYVQALHGLVASHRSARGYRAALDYASRLLAAEPWREDIVRQAMAIHYGSGDSAGALEEYDRFATRLCREMRIAPMPETLALREIIMRGEPLIGSVDATLSARADYRMTRVLPFVARERERTVMQAQWNRAARGSGSVLLVSGEAGIGKTRLIGELARLAESEGGRVYAGSTSSPESSSYQCIVEALRAALPVLTAAPPDQLTLGVLSGVLPELRGQENAAIAVPALEPERESARLIGSLADTIARLATPRPLLLVFEDVHWAAGATIDALAAIARRIERARVLIAVTYREEETPASHPVRALVHELGAERRTAEVHLERFSRDTVAQLVAQLEDLNENDTAVVDRLYAFSEGNALFLNEAIANVLESSGDPLDVTTPLRSIANVIGARTARLGVAAQTVAEIAAVYGQGCRVDVARDVAEFSTAKTLEAFSELLDRRLVREVGTHNRFDYIFTHHLIGTSIYDQIDATARIQCHARIARVLEAAAERRVGDVRELARHYDTAGLCEQAAQWYGQAARDAVAVFANDDAVALASLSIERQHDPSLLVDMLFVREEANARLGNREARAADLDRLEQLAETAELRCRILCRRIPLLRSSDDRNIEREAVAALREQALASADRSWQGRAACADARFLVSIGQFAAAKSAARDALAHFEATGSISDRIEALLHLSEAEQATGEAESADRLIERARSITVAMGDRSAMAEMLIQSATFRLGRVQEGRALSLLDEALEHYRAIGDRVGEAHALLNAAPAAIWLNQWERARNANLAAARTFEAIGDREGSKRAVWNLFLLHARCGDLAEARKLLQIVRGQHEETGNRLGVARSLNDESFIAMAQGHAQQAKSLALAALDAAREIEYEWLSTAALNNLGVAECGLGELDAALIHLDEALARERERGPLAGQDADLLADLALARATHGELEVAADLANEILALDPSWVNSAVFPSYTQWIVACVFHWSGDAERAQQGLASASQLAQSIGSSIDVPELRAHFEALPFNVAIAKAQSTNCWPPPPL